MIPYGRQDISQSDIDAVVAVLQSDFLTQGPAVPKFEQTIATYVGATHAVAVNSATSALHIACLALGLQRGDYLWTSPITFVASANCAIYCGATVDFVDIDPGTYNLCPQALEKKLVLAEREGRLPKIVVPVHLCGQSCDMAAIHALAQRYGFYVIEDASHAIGGRYKGEVVGNCRYSDITVFSFHPVKIITTGEGGMATTNNADLAERMIRHRSHGITSKAEFVKSRPAGEIWNYQQIDIGFNYRITDIHATLGQSQFQRLDEFVQRRHEIARRYNQAFASLPVITPWQNPGVYSSYHLYPIRIREALCGKTQRQVYGALHKAGIGVNLHYIPVYRQPYYVAMGFENGYCPEAELYYREAISLPMFPSLSDAEQDMVIAVLRDALTAQTPA
jgi:UDP-4-amino-4,6-dideoxy-N-acetyl-beta-L-altrosamine transaminase